MALSEQEQKLRHSAAHLAAHALKELFPEVKLTLGPATEHGFFYDFLPTTNIKEVDLPAIEKRMLEIANRSLELTHEIMDKQQARKLYKNNLFKLELIDGISEDHVGIARQGDFYDLCRGGHVKNTSQLKFIKLFLALTGVAIEMVKHCNAFLGLRLLRQKSYVITNAKLKKLKNMTIDALVRILIFFLFIKKVQGFPFFMQTEK
jgi:threonyl-tRNA synthetase